ncbi:F-box protein [Aspergillus lucknowensis]|uniref:C2H2-type domain-containing protein n=1 Tax=Aspergillus lucknowensis TaxID=176173 RepID=A0ABR4LYQ6_9EURO
MIPDLDLCVDNEGRGYTPFYYLITAKQLRPSSLESFHRFIDLPPEIHLQILQCCDTATLFRLMHTSSYLRRESSKLFWEQLEKLWYHCDHYTVNDPEAGCTGLVRYSRHFTRHIRQLEVTLSRMRWRFADKSKGSRGATVQILQMLWRLVQDLFPSVQKVVLTGCQPFRKERLADSEHGEQDLLTAVVELCPPHISCFVAFDLHIHPHLCRLWRLAPGRSWRIVEESWALNRVVIPYSKFPDGSLGDFLSMKRKLSFYHLTRWGIDWLISETYAQYQDGAKFECPAPDCTEKFTEEAQWRQHIFWSSHWCPGNGRQAVALPYHSNTPDDVRAALNERKQRLEEIRASVQLIWHKLKDQCEEHPADFEKSFCNQMMEHKVLDADEPTPGDSQLYLFGFSLFDRTHYLYTGMPLEGY